MNITLVSPPGQAFHTKQALVYHALRLAIMQARLLPGERLVIDEIAQQLEVSPIPVREALQLLQAERLVEHKAHVGAVVSGITAADAHEIFALLAALERAVFAQAIAVITSEQIAELRAIIEQMRVVANDELWMELNHKFHRYIADVAKMPRACEMLGRIACDWERLRRLHFRSAAQINTTAADREHSAMIDALEQRDAATLERLVCEHNAKALAHYVG